MDILSIFGDPIVDLILIILIALIGAIIAASAKALRQTQRGLIERWGKYRKYAKPGLNFIVPFADRMVRVNITEMMVTADPQVIITNDKLNATVDAQVYFKVKDDEESVKASQYNVYDYRTQIIALARTTLRNIIGTMSLNVANSDRNKINEDLMNTLIKETKNWGIEVVRTELKEIDPPKDVQETMNKVVKAENEKQAAVDFATAAETEADGRRRAAIKNADGVKQATVLEAEGNKQAAILKAEGQSQAFELINKSFIENAQLLKKLEVTQACLQSNTKYVIDSKSGITNVISDLGGTNIIPINDQSTEDQAPPETPVAEAPVQKTKPKSYRM